MKVELKSNFEIIIDSLIVGDSHSNIHFYQLLEY